MTSLNFNKEVDPMNVINEDDIIRNAADATVKLIVNNIPLKTKFTKSTFNVDPEDHRMLDILCKLTGLTRQDFFDKSLKKLISSKLYLDDIPIDKIKNLL